MKIGVLIRNETRKTLHRLAFVVTVLFYGFLLALTCIDNLSSALAQPDKNSWELPEAWAQVIGNMGQVGLIFSGVVLILLIAAEFSWRTARQNVIDGLSKTEFFAGKLMLLPMMAVLFLAITGLITGVTAYVGTDMEALTGPLVRPADWMLMAGFAAGILVYGALALLVATLVRSAGSAMGIWFFWVALAEQILPGFFEKIHEGWGAAGAYLPATLAGRLLDPRQHDPAAMAASVQRAIENGNPPPELIPYLWTGSWLWIVLLVGWAYFWFRKRDL
jgi:hypothetical protein